jgi:hypothetical protein
LPARPVAGFPESHSSGTAATPADTAEEQQPEAFPSAVCAFADELQSEAEPPARTAFTAEPQSPAAVFTAFADELQSEAEPPARTAFTAEPQSPAAVFTAFADELQSEAEPPARTAFTEAPQLSREAAVVHSVFFSVSGLSFSDELSEKADTPIKATIATSAKIFFMMVYCFYLDQIYFNWFK